MPANNDFDMPDYDDIDIDAMHAAYEDAMVKIASEIDQVGLRMINEFWREVSAIANRYGYEEEAREHAVNFLLHMARSVAK